MGIAILLVYVDDIVITGFDLEAISVIQTLLHSTFYIPHERPWLAHLFLRL
jgi:hypothetical protein